MTDIALSSPVHLVLHPEEPIRSLGAAAKVVERQGSSDPAAERLAERLRTATGFAEQAAAEAGFREWAEEEGLLLVPPEDNGAHVGDWTAGQEPGASAAVGRNIRQRKGGVDMTPEIDRNVEPMENPSGQPMQGASARRGGANGGEGALAHEEDRLGEEARKLAGTGKRLASTWAENQKSAVSGRLKETASGLRRFGDSLESEPNLKDYLDAAADSLEDVSDQIRSQPVGELMESAQDYARDRPIVLFGTALFAGLVLSRVLRAGYMEAGHGANGRGRHAR